MHQEIAEGKLFFWFQWKGIVFRWSIRTIQIPIIQSKKQNIDLATLMLKIEGSSKPKTMSFNPSSKIIKTTPYICLCKLCQNNCHVISLFHMGWLFKIVTRCYKHQIYQKQLFQAKIYTQWLCQGWFHCSYCTCCF